MGIETLAIAAIGASVIGTGVSMYGQIQQGRAQAAAAQMQGQAQATQARYQQAVAQINQQTAQRNQVLANRNAEFVETAGARLQEDRARRIRATIGAQRAALAANGLVLDEGSGADLQDDTASLGQMALTEIRNNSARQASGYRIAGLNALDEQQAALLRQQGYAASADNAIAAGNFGASAATSLSYINAAGSLLGGATTTFDRWADMRRTGVAQAAPGIA